MPFPLFNMLGRLRAKVDAVEYQRDDLSMDGTSYNIQLSSSPIINNTDSVWLSHITFTTGLNQQVLRKDLIASGPAANTLHLTYTIDYDRGEVEMYQGSGTIIHPTGLVPFAPWNTSTFTAKYKSTKYTDEVLADYLGYAVASVESSLQLGMFISGVRSGYNNIQSGVVAPGDRTTDDFVRQFTNAPYQVAEKFVIADDVEVLQELIAQKAAFDLVTRERRVGAGNAIKIVDGDTQIDTSVNQRYLVDFVRDLDREYKDKLKFVMHNMLEGFTIRQVDELGGDIGYGRTPYGTNTDA